MKRAREQYRDRDTEESVRNREEEKRELFTGVFVDIHRLISYYTEIN